MATELQLDLVQDIQQLQVMKVGKIEADGSRRPSDDYNWIVALINMTDKCLKFGKIGNGENWFPIPTVCRNCSSSYDSCFESKSFSPIFNVRCTDAPFMLTLITEPDNEGNAFGASWNIYPTCKTAGGVIGIT